MGFGLDLFDNAQLRAASALLLLLALGGWGWRWLAIRRSARRRIAAARVRAGHLPNEIPTMRGGLGSAQNSAAPDTLPEWFIQGKGGHAVVDERPRVHLRYRDPQGHKAECTLQIEQVDLRRRFIVGHGDLPGQTRLVPLRAIQSARMAATGQRFNVDFWFDAVKVARRRRGEA